MDVKGTSTTGWDCPKSKADSGSWTLPNIAAESSWECVLPSAYNADSGSWNHPNSAAQNPWESVKPAATKADCGSWSESNTPAQNPWESVEPSASKSDCGSCSESNKEVQNPWESVKPSASKADCGSWSESNTAAQNPWESVEPSASKADWGSWSESNAEVQNPWESVEPSASKADCGSWSQSNTLAQNPWESIVPSASKVDCGSWSSERTAAGNSSDRKAPVTSPNSWEGKQAGNRSKTTTVQRQIPKDFKADVMRMEFAIENPAFKFDEIEVPDSSLPHIIGHGHRNINALRNIPGITRVTTYTMNGTDHGKKHENLIHRVKVEGSSTAVVDKVIAQIRRIVIRSLSNPTRLQVSVICLRQRTEDADGVSLQIPTAEEYQHYLSKHLKPFVIQHAPPDTQERKFFVCGKRITSDQLTSTREIASRKRRKTYPAEGSSYLFGSWDNILFTSSISTCLRRLYQNLDLRGGPPQIKLRIQFGKMFYIGTDLSAPETFNVSIAEMETMTSEHILRPCFSSYCCVDTVRKARELLQASGYEQYKLESSQDTVCAELVDMDSPIKPIFNIKLMQRDKKAVKINKKASRHAFITFVDDVRGLDLQLRIQSRQSEPPLDDQKRRSVYEAWTKRGGMEDPLIAPSGHHYFPTRVLHKVFEYYKKGEIEIVLVLVSPAMEPNNHREFEDDNAINSSRWKISFQQSFIPLLDVHADVNVEQTVTRLTELVDEAKKFSEEISSKTGSFLTLARG